MKQLLLRYLGGFLFLCLLLIGLSMTLDGILPQTANAVQTADKHRGTHVFGYLDTINVPPFAAHNIEWLTMVPYSSQQDFDSPTISYGRGDSLARARRDSVWKEQINIAHGAGFKIFLKPHIWMSAPSAGKWRSDIFPSNDANWQLWQKSYREFILRYAKIAQQSEVEAFCMGTELTRLTIEKPIFWKALIKEIRSVYSGQLTYAANWYEEYENITFWNELDYIGIQAYFPLVDKEYPTVKQITKGWQEYLPAMYAMHKKYKRNILFTEMGYKSTSDSAMEPWKWIDYTLDNNKPLSLETQANCYKAFFNTVWRKDWFAGAHIWQMRSDHTNQADPYHLLDFSPLDKPAIHAITKGFEQK